MSERNVVSFQILELKRLLEVGATHYQGWEKVLEILQEIDKKITRLENEK